MPIVSAMSPMSPMSTAGTVASPIETAASATVATVTTLAQHSAQREQTNRSENKTAHVRSSLFEFGSPRKKPQVECFCCLLGRSVVRVC